MPTFATVTATSLNMRSAPSTSAAIITVLTKGTVLQVLADAGFDWLNIQVDGTASTGYVSKLYVAQSESRPVSTQPAAPVASAPTTTPQPIVTADPAFLSQDASLMSVDLVPAKLIPTQPPNTPQALIARVWNTEGGLLNKLAERLNIPVAGIVATLTAESGGRTFGADGRVIIRFENHIFYNLWGKNNPDVFNRQFDFDRSSPANGWKNHLWRSDAGSPWQVCHSSQDMEYRVLASARALDDTAALQSMSMGAPQIMGFNYRRIGYPTVQAMFDTFSRSAQAQLVAIFDFVKGTNAMQALQSHDYLTFAQIYNGPANATTYQGIIERYSSIFDQLTPR